MLTILSFLYILFHCAVKGALVPAYLGSIDTWDTNKFLMTYAYSNITVLSTFEWSNVHTYLVVGSNRDTVLILWGHLSIPPGGTCV